MSVIRASLNNLDDVRLDVTITATVGEWEALREVIQTFRNTDQTLSGEYHNPHREPFWTLTHRLGDVLTAVKKQHVDYGNK